MCAGAAVVNVAEDVEHVYGESLYDVGYGYDEVVGTPRGYNRVDDYVHVCGLVYVVGAFMQKFLNYVRKVFGERLANFGTCVFA